MSDVEYYITQTAVAIATAFALLVFWSIIASGGLAQGTEVQSPAKEACAEALNDADRSITEFVVFKSHVNEMLVSARVNDHEKVIQAFRDLQASDARITEYLRWYDRASLRCARDIGMDYDDFRYRNTTEQ